MASQWRLQRAKIIFKIWKMGGNPWQNFGRLVMGGGGHMPRLPPTLYPPGLPPPPPPPMQGFLPGGWVPPGEGGQQVRPPPATGLAALGLSDSSLHAFLAALQGVVAAGVSAALPYPVTSIPMGKFATLSLLHLRFACGVEVDGDLPPIWETVAQGKERMEGLATLNQDLMRCLSSCSRVFGGRAHFSASLPLLEFVKNVSLLNPSLDPACTGGGGSCPG